MKSMTRLPAPRLGSEVHTLLMFFAHESLDARHLRTINCWRRLAAEIDRRNTQRRLSGDPELAIPSLETMRRAIATLDTSNTIHMRHRATSREGVQ